MKVVTSGSDYIDIDAYASCIAYAHLLNLKGIPSKAVSSSSINGSITDTFLNFDFKLDNYLPKTDDEFIILDVSNPNFLDKHINNSNVTELIDHHTGFEEFWKLQLGSHSIIEFIGSVATIIVEKYISFNLINKMPVEIAYLLMAAILDNTLFFKAKITSSRDISAYETLQKITSDDGSFPEKYFKECQTKIEAGLPKNILDDTKTGTKNNFLPDVFSQLVIWDFTSLNDYKSTIENTLNSTFNSDWIMNMICLKDGKSYILSNIKNKNIETLFNKTFDSNNILELNNVWLRKEIIKKSN